MKDIYIVLPEELGTIAPEIYGHFSEHIGGVMRDGAWVGKDSPVPNVRGWRTQIVEKLKAINAPVIRWPGGCFAETYDWRDGIGSDRPRRINWWMANDGRVETNEVGTHEFMDFCEQVGAKPYFAVNITSITPLQARDWLDYCLSPAESTDLALLREKNGRKEPFDIPYFGIGNENWGGGGEMTPEFYASVYRRFATVMGNVPSGTPKDFFACGACAEDFDWTQRLAVGFKEKHSKLDGMTIHYYCGGAGECTDYTVSQWYELLQKAEKMDDIIERNWSVVKGYGLEKSMKLVIDEWGCWHPGGSGPSKGYNLFEQQATMRDAVVAALTMNIFNNRCSSIKMANVAQLCNNLHAPFLADKEHCVETVNYYVFDMFKNHMGATAVRTVVKDNEDITRKVSASASVKNGAVTLTLANCSCERAVTVRPVLLGGASAGMKLRTLSAESRLACNTFDEPYKIVPVEAATNGKTVTIPKGGVAEVTIRLK